MDYVTKYFNFIMDQTTRYVRYYQAVNELSRLDDRELKDIGINRVEIPYVVYEAMVKSV